MKAVVCPRYGSPDVLRIEEIATPVPKDNEVLLEVQAASVNPLDNGLMRGTPHLVRVFFGFRKPRSSQVGRDVAGRVEAVGRAVAEFKPGDEVFGTCRGAFAEHACALAAELVRKPDRVTFEEAAAAPIAGLTALQGLRDKARLHAGQTVLIHGAGGGVGTFAVQIARAFGAHVTAVTSPQNLGLVRSLGAAETMDYTREDFTKSGRRFDIVLDCYSNRSIAGCRQVLNPGGAYVPVGGPQASAAVLLGRVTAFVVLSWVSSQRFVVFVARVTKADLTVLRDLMATGRITPVIDRRYGLVDVPEALRYLEQGHARGKVVIAPSLP